MRRLTSLAVGIALVLLATIAPVTTPATAAEQAVTNTSVGTHNTHYGNASFPAVASIIGWQEVESPAAQQKMRDRLPGYRHWSPDGNGNAPQNYIPISWRDDGYTFVSGGSTMTHVGEAGVTPNRYVNHVVLQHRKTGAQVAVVNTHFISGAYSGKPERQARWQHHATVLRQEISALRQRGLPVLLVGDFNRRAELGIPGMTRLKVPGQSGVPLDQVYVSGQVSQRGPLEQLGMFGSDVHFAYKAPVSF